MTTPVVLIVGRVGPADIGFRGGSFRAGERYLHAIDRAGAVGVIAAPIPDAIDRTLGVLERVDAVVLHGGGDIDPARYGAASTTDELYDVVDAHDQVELAVCRAALDRDLPVLAICRGMQILDVALGGTLHQHIGSEHRMRHHDVEVTGGTRLRAAIGPGPLAGCHCVHHQALADVAEELEVVASTADGVVHAVEHRAASWVLGVQWHPEDTAGDDRRQQALFDALVARTR